MNRKEKPSHSLPLSLHTVRFGPWSLSRWFTDLTSPTRSVLSSQSERSSPNQSLFPTTTHLGECSIEVNFSLFKHRKRENYSHTNRHIQYTHPTKQTKTKNSFTHVTTIIQISFHILMVLLCEYIINKTKKKQQKSKYK